MPRWRIEPPHGLSSDSCLALQCAPHSRTATLLWTSLFLPCCQVVFGRPLFLLPSGVHVRAVTQSLSGCCLRMCPMNLHLLLLTSSLLSSTVFLGALLASSVPELPCGFHSGTSCCEPLGPQDSVDCLYV